MRSIHLLYKHMQRAALGLYKLQAASWPFPCYYWFNAAASPEKFEMLRIWH